MITNEDILLTDEVYRVQFISVFNDKIYLSGLSDNNPKHYSIYSIDLNGDNLALEIEKAKGAILTDEYIYYHDDEIMFENGIYRKNIATNEIEELISREYFCSDLTMNIVGDYLYAHNSIDIFKYDLNTRELINMTSGKYEFGLNKLQYHNGLICQQKSGQNTANQKS